MAAKEALMLVGRPAPLPNSERSRRWREKQKQKHGATPAAAAATWMPTASSSSTWRVHPTRRLESIGSTPEAYARIPPPVDAPAAAAAPPTADQEAGAAKIAALVAGLTNFAASDAAKHFQLRERVGDVGLQIGAATVKLDVDAAIAAATAHVFEATRRACLKHGLGLHLPYEDEVTAIGAVLASAGWLAVRWSGQLDKPAKPAGEPVDIGGPVPRHRPPVVDDGPDFDMYGTIKVEAA